MFTVEVWDINHIDPMYKIASCNQVFKHQGASVT